MWWIGFIGAALFCLALLMMFTQSGGPRGVG